MSALIGIFSLTQSAFYGIISCESLTCSERWRVSGKSPLADLERFSLDGDYAFAVWWSSYHCTLNPFFVVFFLVLVGCLGVY